MDDVVITTTLVRQLIAAQFPAWAGLPVTSVELDGWDNRTFRLGEELSVRLPSADGYVPQVDKELRWLPVLAPHLPLPIPEPVARGRPTDEFPRPWAVHRWRPGAPAEGPLIDDLECFAVDLARFLAALNRIDAAGGPPPGAHNGHRGGSLRTYDAETRAALGRLEGRFDTVGATAIWDNAIASEWDRPAVWVHGDVTASNLLVVDGRLSAVIDFGCVAVGDPSCDLVIAWTLLAGPSRRAFAQELDLDDGTWQRARGWALWKALITMTGAAHSGSDRTPERRAGWRTDAASLVRELIAE